MQKRMAHRMELQGSNGEIGRRLGMLASGLTGCKERIASGMEGFGPGEVDEARKPFERWCPGLEEELESFAQALDVKAEDLFFYGMTYLRPRCSQIALLPAMTAEGKPLVARNYEFNPEAEDFCLARTSVDGRYAHLGTTVLFFGRDDGINEHGLSVTMSSCGFPVGALPDMGPPRIKGLQFWAVIRTLLENCRDVYEALAYLEGMPIAYNLNLLLADKGGRAALFETLDGASAFKEIGPESGEKMLWATNHAVLPDLMAGEREVMVHSLKRYDYIAKELQGRSGVEREKLKAMLLARYPEGLCCHHYADFFGTTKSMILSPEDGTVEICWGGRAENGWRTYAVDHPLEEGGEEIEMTPEEAEAGTFAFHPRG